MLHKLLYYFHLTLYLCQDSSAIIELVNSGFEICSHWVFNLHLFSELEDFLSSCIRLCAFICDRNLVYEEKNWPWFFACKLNHLLSIVLTTMCACMHVVLFRCTLDACS